MIKIKTKVVHSESKPAWNVIGDIPGAKYKIARVPYVFLENGKECEIVNTLAKNEALKHALFISECFNKEYDKEN